ncbi:hypothetical protein HPP92_010273 [Vanilla planifolia]|uniref:SLH domain-containing protein n=1 Tax=Vanilla planifolia TaxID=51239 RepID=A0A835R0H5_VANPL|nr:hypothetical protein HPP92_010273 [Vanilla planifolia]
MGLSMPLSPPFRPCKLSPTIPLVSTSWNRSRSSLSLRKKRFMHAMQDKIDISWAYLDDCSDEDGFCGWSVRRFDAEKQNGFQSLVKAGIGASVAAILLAAVAYCCRTKKVVGFQFKENAPFITFHDLWPFFGNSKGTMPSIFEIPVERTDLKCSVPKQQNKVPASGGNKRIIIPVADLTQMDALHALKKLKIIEYDTNANELCTRREFARWLIKINSKLERKAKHKIVPIVVNADSLVAAFDDVDMNDPDFIFIQALGEAGIVPSRLSSSNLSHSNDEGFLFTPDNFISRLDMLNWKAMVEYSIPSEMKEISRTNACLLDLNANCPKASPQLLIDLMHDDGSVVPRTFGNIRRLQSDVPVTKAQAAVALTCGRMTDVIRSEISRLEAEEQSRFVEMEAIKSELIRSGAIHKLWEEKQCETRNLTLQADRDLESALFDLEVERAAEDERLADYLKEKAALECQQELLLCLTKEVDEMRRKLVDETAIFKVEKQKLESDVQDLVEKRGAILEARSVLESEKAAIHILRSWVEEESWRIQSRAKVLEQAILRWKVVGAALPNQLREQAVNQ